MSVFDNLQNISGTSTFIQIIYIICCFIFSYNVVALVNVNFAHNYISVCDNKATVLNVNLDTLLCLGLMKKNTLCIGTYLPSCNVVCVGSSFAR